MTDFLGPPPFVPDVPRGLDPLDQTTARFLNHRYTAECFASAPEIPFLPPAEGRTWMNDQNDYISLAREDIRHVMD